MSEANNQMTLVSHKTAVNVVEQQNKGGEDVISESYSLLISLQCRIMELNSMVNDHDVTTPKAIMDKVSLISELAEEYSTAVWNENTDPSKAIQLSEE